MKQLGPLAVTMFLALSACGHPAAPPSGPTPDPGWGSGSDDGSATAVTPAPAPGRGETCGPAGDCADGMTCVEYYGIAGASGPKFAQCETPCPGGAACPDGLVCITIADGPGQVCRAPGQ